MRGAVGAAPRIVAEDFDLDGYRLTTGTILSLSTSAANHDPAAYVDGDVFDITAQREPQLTFGGGPHYCLGANLARAELQEALSFLPARMPGLALDDEPELGSIHGIYGLERLPLRWS